MLALDLVMFSGDHFQVGLHSDLSGYYVGHEKSAAHQRILDQ
jgi:hypothetical protein